MESHNLILSGLKRKSSADSHVIEMKSQTDNPDEGFYISTVEDLSPPDRAQKNIQIAKQLFEEKQYIKAIGAIQEAIQFYKGIENKSVEEWCVLTTCYELDRQIYQHQNQVLLDINQKILRSLKENTEVREDIQDEMTCMRTEFESAVDTAMSQMRCTTQALQAQNAELNQQIQSLQDRPQPTLMEYITHGIQSAFDAIRHCTLHLTLAQYIGTFFANVRAEHSSCSADEVDSIATMEMLKNV